MDFVIFSSFWLQNPFSKSWTDTYFLSTNTQLQCVRVCRYFLSTTEAGRVGRCRSSSSSAHLERQNHTSSSLITIGLGKFFSYDIALALWIASLDILHPICPCIVPFYTTGDNQTDTYFHFTRWYNLWFILKHSIASYSHLRKKCPTKKFSCVSFQMELVITSKRHDNEKQPLYWRLGNYHMLRLMEWIQITKRGKSSHSILSTDGILF